MRPNFTEVLDKTLKEEGGFANNPSDPGGATMKGITLATYRSFVGRPDASVEELKNIDPKVVETIYYKLYWEPMRCNDLPAGLDAAVFDFGVNAGTKRSIIVLQRVLGVADDGLIGPGTMKALDGLDVKEAIVKFSESRRDFYRGLKLFPTFGKGWLSRVDRFEPFCLYLLEKCGSA